VAIYMKYEGVNGGVTTSGFENWIDLMSCQFGHVRNVTAVGTNDSRKGTPTMSEVVVTKETDKASPDLFRESVTGDPKKVTIAFSTTAKDKMDVYLRVELEKTLISSYQLSGAGRDANAKPTETLTLNFTKITYTAVSRDANVRGTPNSASWDLTNQTGG
jgi:type VI secretion system secreted protein Hcp